MSMLVSLIKIAEQACKLVLITLYYLMLRLYGICMKK